MRRQEDPWKTRSAFPYDFRYPRQLPANGCGGSGATCFPGEVALPAAET